MMCSALIRALAYIIPGLITLNCNRCCQLHFPSPSPFPSPCISLCLCCCSLPLELTNWLTNPTRRLRGQLAAHAHKEMQLWQSKWTNAVAVGRGTRTDTRTHTRTYTGTHTHSETDAVRCELLDCLVTLSPGLTNDSCSGPADRQTDCQAGRQAGTLHTPTHTHSHTHAHSLRLCRLQWLAVKIHQGHFDADRHIDECGPRQGEGSRRDTHTNTRTHTHTHALTHTHAQLFRATLISAWGALTKNDLIISEQVSRARAECPRLSQAAALPPLLPSSHALLPSLPVISFSTALSCPHSAHFRGPWSRTYFR